MFPKQIKIAYMRYLASYGQLCILHIRDIAKHYEIRALSQLISKLSAQDVLFLDYIQS